MPLPVDPVHHPGEGLPGLPAVVEPLLLVVQIGIVDAGGARHQQVAVPGDVHEAAVRRGGLLVPQFANVPEEDRRGEVPLDVGLQGGSSIG